MSELSVRQYLHNDGSGLTWGYDKSEADNVIAELEESHKMEVEQLLLEIVELKKKLTAAQQAQPDVRTQTLGGESSEGGKMKTLTLPLKKQWFDMIKAGAKKEEYREIKPYYNARFCEPLNSRIFHSGETGAKTFDRLVFTLGYPKADDTERRLEFKNPKIRIGTGMPEWGAEPGKNYFVITWSE